MKVYFVLEEKDTQFGIELNCAGIFNKKEDAEKIVKKNKNYCVIKEMEMNKNVSVELGFFLDWWRLKGNKMFIKKKYIKMNRQEFDVLIEKHRKWLNKEEGGLKKE